MWKSRALTGSPAARPSLRTNGPTGEVRTCHVHFPEFPPCWASVVIPAGQRGRGAAQSSLYHLPKQFVQVFYCPAQARPLFWPPLSGRTGLMTLSWAWPGDGIPTIGWPSSSQHSHRARAPASPALFSVRENFVPGHLLFIGPWELLTQSPLVCQELKINRTMSPVP